MKGFKKVNISLGCSLLGFSRQAYYKPQTLQKELTALTVSLKELVEQERQYCPGKGCRAIYFDNADELSIGRDKAERIMREQGLMISLKSKYIRTTQAGKRIFDNLLVESIVNNLNQVWQADMSYFIVRQKVYYLIFITDVYSQRILGSGAYDRAFAIHFVEVLSKAIELRKKQDYSLEGLIHHSDGGKQYEATIYMDLCKQNGISQSMCYYSWENPYAEKTNDLIKNRYLKYWKPENLKELKIYLENAVRDHNENQSKKALRKLSPIDFEETLKETDSRLNSYKLNLKPSLPTNKRKTINLKCNQT